MLTLIALTTCTLINRLTRINWHGPLTAGDQHTCQHHDPVLQTYCALTTGHAGLHDDTLGCAWTLHRPHTTTPNIVIHGEPAT